MKSIGLESQRATETDLERIVEPLASYICATEQPHAALKTAFKVLLAEVKMTRMTAKTHIATFAGSTSL